jgi:hypothetical protein
MKRLLNFTLITILTVLNCYAQNDWKPGYIIENSGDTIYGFIDNRDSRSNSKRCYFLKEDLGEKKILEPKDISGFRFINGKFFVSKTIPSGDSTQRMFLEFIIHGKADIFHYKDDEDYFFIEKDGQMYRLKNTSETQKKDATTFEAEKIIEHEKKEYIGVLNFLMYDAKMQSEINNCTLATKSLLKVAKKYHERVCSGEQCIVYEKKSNMHVKWGLHFGEAINNFNFGDRFVTNYNITSFLGCRLKFENVLDWAENVSFSTDITFHKFSKYELHQINYSAIVKYNNLVYTLYPGSKLNVDLKVIAIKVPITVNYLFSRGNVRPYVNLGISNTFILSQNKDFIYMDFNNFFKKSIPSYLLLGFVGRIGSEFILKNSHSIYCDINLDYSQNSGTGAFIFTNKMYSFSIGYAF